MPSADANSIDNDRRVMREESVNVSRNNDMTVYGGAYLSNGAVVHRLSIDTDVTRTTSAQLCCCALRRHAMN